MKNVLAVTKTVPYLSSIVFAIPFIATAQSVATSAQSAKPVPLSPMPADSNPAFEVATIKPSDTSSPHGTFIRHDGRHLIAYNMSLRGLIVYAYGLHASQIVNGPPSLLATHFDIDGVPDIDGHPNLRQSKLMFQRLLLSRFKLAFHYESHELAAYAVQVAQNGPHLMPTNSKPDDSTNFTISCPPVLTVRNYSIADFAKGMQDAFLDKPVVDQTGLKDRYDFVLKWTADESQSFCPVSPAGSSPDPNAPPGLYTAVQEQLGLKLVSTKAPVEVMVIDHIETPSGN